MKEWTAQQGETYWRLELEDSIRKNRMIQGEIDIDGFWTWYGELSRDQRCNLAFNTFICEQHYSGGKDVVLQALNRSGKNLQHRVVKGLMDLVGGFDASHGFTAESGKPYASQRAVTEWLKSLTELDLKSAFEFCVFLFGIHEGERFNACAGNCSHWWHQNLKDPVLVKQLLASSKSP